MVRHSSARKALQVRPNRAGRTTQRRWHTILRLCSTLAISLFCKDRNRAVLRRSAEIRTVITGTAMRTVCSLKRAATAQFRPPRIGLQIDATPLMRPARRRPPAVFVNAYVIRCVKVAGTFTILKVFSGNTVAVNNIERWRTAATVMRPCRVGLSAPSCVMQTATEEKCVRWRDDGCRLAVVIKCYT